MTPPPPHDRRDPERASERDYLDQERRRPPADSAEYRVWLHEQLARYDQRLTAHVGSIRADMRAFQDELRSLLTEHQKEDRLIADKVLVIETERRIETEHAKRAGAIYGTLAGTAVSGIIAGLKMLFSGNPPPTH